MALAGLQLGIIIYPPTVLQERGFKLVFYDTSDVKIGELGTDVQAAHVSDVSFELNDFGCGAFSFHVDALPSFNPTYRTRVNVYPYFDTLPWFAGFIQRRPDPGAKKPFEYSGFGYFDQLDWITVTKSYSSGQDISLIVKDILSTIVAPKTAVIYNAAKVETTGYVTSGTIDFDHIKAKDAIQNLADTAQNFEFGVDDQREFYFRAIDATLKKYLWRGKHFQDSEITIDPLQIRNKLYIKAGQITGGSNVIGSVTDDISIILYGLREDVVTAPDLLNSTDATRWANYQLGQLKYPITQAKIVNYFLDQDKAKIAALGQIRLNAEDGTAYTLPVKRVTYKMSAAGILADIELGRVIVPFEQQILDILRRVQEESSLADKRTAQLSA
jgi:hypothetical protein